MYFVLAYIDAKITKKCKHCIKLELISNFIKLVFKLRMVHENQIFTLFSKIFA